MIRRKQDGAAELENGHGTDSDCQNIDPPCCCDETPSCLDLVGMIEFANTDPNGRRWLDS